ncbi:MAG: peptidylprolyl isomerase [Chloroflexota bacterium]
MAKKQRNTPSVRKRREEALKRQEQQNRMITIIAAVLGVAVVGFIIWQLLPEPAVEPTATGSSGTIGTAVEGERPLAALDPIERNGFYSEFPEMVLEDGVDYQARLVTSQGDMVLDLFEDVAPLTVNNFVFLANQGFYDGTIFHRVIPDFMAQAGDPSGTGSGGPGYQFEDETDNGLVFNQRGQLAMANAGPGTNGSQFFITFIPTDWLTGNHTIFGEMIEGDDILGSVTIRDPQAGGPADTIERIEILEN